MAREQALATADLDDARRSRLTLGIAGLVTVLCGVPLQKRAGG